MSTMRMLRREEAVASSSSSTQAAVSVAESAAVGREQPRTQERAALPDAIEPDEEEEPEDQDKRSSSVPPVSKRNRHRNLHFVGVEALKRFGRHLRDHDLRPPAETIKDLRGNRMSITSRLGGSARAAGAGCQPAAGAGCQPVDPDPVAAGTRPDPKAPPSLFGRSAAAPSGAADAAGSVEFLNLDDGRAGAGTDAGRPGHDAILDGMQALRDGMGALEAALTAMPPAMATKDDIAALTTAMETGFDEMHKRFNDMEEKVQSLQHGWKVAAEGAAEGAAEDHEGEASGPVCAHSMDAEGWRARFKVQDVEG